MAKITTVSSLTTTEVTIDPISKTIKLNIAGNLSSDGVSLRALYAFCKQQWKVSATLIAYPFPINAITDTKYDLISGWDFKDLATRQLIRDGGWAVKNSTDNITSLEEWMNFNTVGVIGSTDQVYYTQNTASGAAVGIAIPLAGAANTAIKIYGDSTHGSIDYRTSFTCYVRSQGKTYDSETLASIGVTTLTYQSYFFPMDSVADSNITDSDSVIDTTIPYTGMSITYSTTAYTRTINGTSYNFNWIIAANNATRTQVYQYVQRQLRKTTNINAASGGTNTSMIGSTTTPLVKFSGNQLITSTGVYIDNLAPAEQDFVDFYDATATKRNLPFLAVCTLQFNDVLVNDTDAIYRVYFTSSYGTSSAIIVNDATGTAIAGNVSGRSSITFTFDYDNNVQGGRTVSTDALVTIVAIGLTSGQYTRTTSTIGRNINNKAFLASSAERNYYTS